jgi:Domain of unknown function (DUF4384)
MTQDEIRKLLGGYATNELSADERRILFEAALEDQELFNALENEDALRELLADPVSRDQVRRALAVPMASKRRPGFWSRRWVLGVAIPAVAALIVVAIMNRANAPRLIAPPVQIASNEMRSSARPAPAEIKPAPLEVKPLAKQHVAAKKLDRVVSAEPANAARLVLPRPVQLQSPRAAIASLTVNGAPRMPEAVRQQFSAGFAGNVPQYQGPLVRYSIVRSGPAGDGVRVAVTTSIPGYLALYEVDAAGNSKRVYPSSDVAAPVQPTVTIRIPTDPIKMAGARDRLRLVVVPQAVVVSQSFGAVGTVGGFVNGVVDQAASTLPAAPTPLVVDIPLAPN